MDPMVLMLGIIILLLNVPHCQSRSWKLVPTLQVRVFLLGLVWSLHQGLHCLALHFFLIDLYFKVQIGEVFFVS